MRSSGSISRGPSASAPRSGASWRRREPPSREHPVSRYVFKLPDLGEGTVDAEIVAWRVKPGDTVAEDDPLVEMMTEKATVEVPAPVSGRIVSVRGEPGEKVAVGSELVVFETEAAERAGNAASGAKPAARDGSASHAASGSRVLTSPAI